MTPALKPWLWADDRTLKTKEAFSGSRSMIRLLRIRHAAAGYRVGAVRAQYGAARALEHQAGRGPSKLPPSWGLATTQVSSMFATWRMLQRPEVRSRPRPAYGEVRGENSRVSPQPVFARCEQVTRAAHDLPRPRSGPSTKSAEVQIGTSQVRRLDWKRGHLV
jgi:hypothetical protein